ncbi:molybdenum cofactor guanylyltransferase MobA [Rhodoferax sp.]|uniref:molybdenum cofactor guanylyltransferase MobA n=1 Tax=Rhodoferax sp. TaxID=50421 RepID=UPI0028469D1C|nr:molybdenum cofactor guanylyltransferase MobA [Rhodoferax sp.]MDR3369418.1 molybdenum cofactor guanylyltransferase MobA [Rhodoferax sp.]
MNAKDITGLILAGGRGLRMGGADKGLQSFQGVSLAMHTLNRLRAGGGVGSLAINANRHLLDYEALGVPVWPDADSDYAGPLAGFLTGLAHCQTPYLLTVPCDVPLFPLDLAQRLATTLEAEHADLAIAVAPQSDGHGQMPLRAQPVFCLMRVSLLPDLSQFIQSGRHRVQDWCDLHTTALARFDQPEDNAQAFSNANTLNELHQLESQTP